MKRFVLTRPAERDLDRIKSYLIQKAGPLDLARSPNGHLPVANSDGRNADPNQPSELVEFTAGGEFLSQFLARSQQWRRIRPRHPSASAASGSRP